MTKKAMYRQILEAEGYGPLSGDVNTSFGVWVNTNVRGGKRYARLTKDGEVNWSATNPQLGRSGSNGNGSNGKGEKTMEKTVTMTEKQLQELLKQVVEDSWVAGAMRDALEKGKDNGQPAKAKAKKEKAVQAKPERPYINLNDEPLMVLDFDDDYKVLLDRVEKARKVEMFAGKKNLKRPKARCTYELDGERVFVVGDRKRSRWLVMPAHTA